MAVDVHTYPYKLKNGKKQYGFRFEIAPIGGQRKWLDKRGFATKGEAIKAGNEALAKYNNTGDISQPSDMSFSDFLDYWIEHDCKVDLKQITVANYEKKIRLYIKPTLGGYRLRAIKKDDLQGLLMALYNQGFSIKTLTVIKGILSKSFDYAVDRKYILHSPANRLKLPRNQTPEIATRSDPHIYIPKDKMQEILARFPEGTVNHIPLMLGYKCGLRLGEAFAVTWDDIDLENKTLTVNHQVQWNQDKSRTAEDKKAANGKTDCGKGFWYLTTPKYNSVRTIELDDELTALLSREKAKQEKAQAYYGEFYYHYFVDNKNIINTVGRGDEIHFLTVRESGEYITARTMQHTSRVIHYKMNFPEFDYHSLRHTHTTMLLEQGAPIKFIQNRLGHKNIEVTLNIYSHLTEDISKQGTEILNKMYA
ncbi:MAG: site-specific integrase [Oscillospiraceae bacterium]|nr:site-specific integrase [Oscillospiraceae bacterium]